MGTTLLRERQLRICGLTSAFCCVCRSLAEVWSSEEIGHTNRPAWNGTPLFDIVVPDNIKSQNYKYCVHPLSAYNVLCSVVERFWGRTISFQTSVNIYFHLMYWINALRMLDTTVILLRHVSVWQCHLWGVYTKLNPLTPNDHYSGRTAPLTSKRCILYIYSTNIGAEYFKHGIYSPFFSP